jgi:bifunctional isochorismate lyase/aryl carrier protein
MSAGVELTSELLRSYVADALGADAATLRDDEPLPEQGLDSIRLMAVVERLRAIGADITFTDLAEAPTLRQWANRLGTDA